MTDQYDAHILTELRADGRLSWTKLGDRVNLSPSACQRRVEALIDGGVIENFTVNLNEGALGFGVKAFVSVNVDRQHNELAKDFRQAVLDHSKVRSCHMISGGIDFLLEVVATDLEDFGRFIDSELLAMPAVKDASSSIVLNVIKR